MNRKNIIYKVGKFYVDGFRNMTIGKTLWTIILIKLFVIFVLLRLFFFPDVVRQRAKNGDRAGYVASELLRDVDSANKQAK